MQTLGTIAKAQGTIAKAQGTKAVAVCVMGYVKAYCSLKLNVPIHRLCTMIKKYSGFNVLDLLAVSKCFLFTSENTNF